MRVSVAAMACLSLLAQGCATAAGSDPQKSAELQRSIEHIAHDAHGRVGVAVRELETGETVTVAGDERFPMQSVYKMPIALAVLHDVDVGLLKIDQSIDINQARLADGMMYSPIREKFPGGAKLTIGELLGYAVSQSDKVASDVLMGLAGGPHRISAYLRDLGTDEVRVVNTEREMAADGNAQYQNWATPRGALTMLAKLHAGAGLSSQSQKLLRGALIDTSTGPRRIKGLLPPETVVAHKTGTSGVAAGRAAATNDIGIITLPDGRHLAVVVFVSDSTADTGVRESTIARIARPAGNRHRKRAHLGAESGPTRDTV